MLQTLRKKLNEDLCKAQTKRKLKTSFLKETKRTIKRRITQIRLDKNNYLTLIRVLISIFVALS